MAGNLADAFKVNKDVNLLSDVQNRLNTMAKVFGYTFDGFNPIRDGVVTSKPLKMQGKSADGYLQMAGVQVEVTNRVEDNMFAGSKQNIIDSVTKTTVVASEKLLNDLFRLAEKSNQKLDPEKMGELKDNLQNIVNDFTEQITALDIQATQSKTSIFEQDYKSIVAKMVPKLAVFLFEAEQSLGIPDQQKREWYAALLNAELDVLSANKRSVKVAIQTDHGIYIDDNGKQQTDTPGSIVEIAWPLNNISSLDRREASPIAEQVRVNFWLQQTLHYDNEGNLLSTKFAFRGASPNVLDIKDKTQRLEATKHAILNELRMYVFIHLAEAIANGMEPEQAIQNFMKKDGVLQVDNLGLMSTCGKEFKMVNEIRKAYAEILADAKKEGGLKFFTDRSPSLVDELVRISGKEDIRAQLETLRFNPSVKQDNLGTNSLRGADSPSDILPRIPIIGKRLQYNLRLQANRERFASFAKQIIAKASEQDNKLSSALGPFAKLFAKTQTGDNGEIFWRQNKTAYLAALDVLRKQVTGINADKDLLAEYERLTVFAMHLEHNLKPQICPLKVGNILLKNTDTKMSFIRQVLTSVIDQEVIGRHDAEKIDSLLAQVFNCKSGKDRTGVFMTFKAAWQIIMDNQRKQGIPIDYNRLDEYIKATHELLPSLIARTVGHDIANANSEGSNGFLGQNQGKSWLPSLIYEGNLVKDCNFKEQNHLARLKDVRWKPNEDKKLGFDGGDYLNRLTANEPIIDTNQTAKEEQTRPTIGRCASTKIITTDEDDLTKKPIDMLINLLSSNDSNAPIQQPRKSIFSQPQSVPKNLTVVASPNEIETNTIKHDDNSPKFN